jgi:hypothetical protein
MRAETILGFIEVDVDYHMALLWCAMAECAQDPVKGEEYFPGFDKGTSLDSTPLHGILY